MIVGLFVGGAGGNGGVGAGGLWVFLMVELVVADVGIG